MVDKRKTFKKPQSGRSNNSPACVYTLSLSLPPSLPPSVPPIYAVGSFFSPHVEVPQIDISDIRTGSWSIISAHFQKHCFYHNFGLAVLRWFGRAGSKVNIWRIAPSAKHTLKQEARRSKNKGTPQAWEGILGPWWRLPCARRWLHIKFENQITCIRDVNVIKSDLTTKFPLDIGPSSSFGTQSTTAKRGVHFCNKKNSF